MTSSVPQFAKRESHVFAVSVSLPEVFSEMCREDLFKQVDHHNDPGSPVFFFPFSILDIYDVIEAFLFIQGGGGWIDLVPHAWIFLHRRRQ